MNLFQRIRAFFAPAKPAPAFTLFDQKPLIGPAPITREMVLRMHEDTELRRLIADSEYGVRGSATPPVRADKISRPIATRPEQDAPYKRQEESIVPLIAGVTAYEFVSRAASDSTPTYSDPDPTPSFSSGGGDFGGGGASGSWSD